MKSSNSPVLVSRYFRMAMQSCSRETSFSNRVFSCAASVCIFLKGLCSLLALVIIDLVLCAAQWISPIRLQAKNLAGKVVLITGAGSGIGRLMAEEFAMRGCRVVLLGKKLKDVIGVAEQITARGGEAYAYECDVSERKAVFVIAAAVQQDVGRVDVLVNNAGIVHGHTLRGSCSEEAEETMRVNLLAHFWTTQAFLPAMQDVGHGHVVAISSVAGLIGASGLTDYCASKFGVIGFCESLIMELHKDGFKDIHVTCVCPYQIDTNMFRGVRTRYEWLFPRLSADYVARRTVDAVACNWDFLIMPRLMYLVPLLKALLPTRSRLAAADFLGITTAMDSFQKSS